MVMRFAATKCQSRLTTKLVRIRPPFPSVVGLYGGTHGHQQRRNTGHRSSYLPHRRSRIRRTGRQAQWWHQPLLPQRQRGEAGSLRTANGLQHQEDDLRRGRRHSGGRSLKAVVPGGSSTPVLLPSEIDVGMDFAQVGMAAACSGREAWLCSAGAGHELMSKRNREPLVNALLLSLQRKIAGRTL